MKLRVYRTLWGLVDATDGDKAESPHKTLDTALPALKELGYDGVEVPFKVILQYGNDRFKRLLSETDLKVIIMVLTDGPVVPGHPGDVFGGPYPGFSTPTEPGASDKTEIVETHLKIFKEQVVASQEFNPTFINSHSCKDYFTREMGLEFFKKAIAWQEENGYTVYHETHRKRFLHSPWMTRDLMSRMPSGLEMVADLSHWINVAETNSDDPDLVKVIEDLAPKFRHTHARVGYDHGPQVPDPRHPSWIGYMEGHERWWDSIWKALEARGDVDEVTMTPEHGPPNYQICDLNGKPLADIWDVNHWIALRRQERFAELFGKENTSSLVPSKTQGPEPRTNPGKSVIDGKSGPVGFKE